MTTVPKPLYVAIVDDSPIVVLSVTALLAPFGRLVRIASYADRFPQRGRADIVLYDPFVPPNTLGRLREIGGETGALMLAFSGVMDEAQIVDAMKAGAAGVLSKTADGPALMAALEGAAAGEIVRPVPERGPRAEPMWPGEHEGLNAQESAVVSLIVAAMSNQEIADALSMSNIAVKTHIRSAYRMMGVTSRVEAVSWGVDHGFQLSAPVARRDEGGQR